jgi:hypothetical protein
MGSAVPVLVNATEQPLISTARAGAAANLAVCDKNLLIMLGTPFLILCLSTAYARSLDLSLPWARITEYIETIDRFLDFFKYWHLYCISTARVTQSKVLISFYLNQF